MEYLPSNEFNVLIPRNTTVDGAMDVNQLHAAAAAAAALRVNLNLLL